MDKSTQKNLLDLVKRNYEDIATDFDNTRKKHLWPELVKLASMVRDGDKVLDIGCGNGRLTGAFNDKKINYLGVDSSEKLIAAAKRNQELGIKNQEFSVGNILELDKILEKDFDYVFCVAVLHHLPGDDLRVAALEQMKNKIKADGKIIITVWSLWRQKKFSKLIYKFALAKILGRNKMDFGDILFDWKNNLAEPVSRRYYHAFTGNGLKNIIKQAGLKLEKLSKDNYNYYAILRK